MVFLDKIYFFTIPISESYNALPEAWKMFQKFCGYTTVQGLVYIFVQNLSPIGKVYWISAFIMLISLGSFWAAKMYSDWQNVQVYQLRSNIFFFYFLCKFLLFRINLQKKLVEVFDNKIIQLLKFWFRWWQQFSQLVFLSVKWSFLQSLFAVKEILT
jgi:hypothetical protein